MRRLCGGVQCDWEKDGTILRKTEGERKEQDQGKTQAWIPADQGTPWWNGPEEELEIVESSVKGPDLE